MAPEPSAAEQELESLLQFLYNAPIGLVQASIDGEILLINAKSSQLLMPLAPRGELTNLFDVFEDLAPDLRLRADAHAPPCGLVCEGMPLRVAGRGPGRREPQVLSLTVVKLEASRLIAAIDDISAAMHRDDALRRDAAVDLLTGVANRWAFFEAAEAQCQCWVRASAPQPLELALFDVAPSTAQRGRADRDAALHQVATHLAAAFGTGALHGRITEGRFAVLLPRLPTASAEALVDHVCRAIAATPQQLDGVGVPGVEVSAGIAAMQADVTGIDELLERAESARRDAGTRVPAETL